MGQTAMTTTLTTIGGVAGLALVAWPLAIWWEVRKCEKPRYTVLRTLGQRRTWLGKTVPVAEVRQYAPYLVAEVVMQGGDMRQALGGGFRQIAGAAALCLPACWCCPTRLQQQEHHTLASCSLPAPASAHRLHLWQECGGRRGPGQQQQGGHDLARHAGDGGRRRRARLGQGGDDGARHR